MVGLAGARSVQVPLTEDGGNDLEAMAAAITERTTVVLLCSPNNPTGPALTRDAVEAFLKKVPEHVVVVLDEAYYGFCRLSELTERPGWPGCASGTRPPTRGSPAACACPPRPSR